MNEQLIEHDIDPAHQQAILTTWPREQLLARNLSALRERDLDLADRIAETQIPENAEFTLARDGAPTYRFRDPDGRRPWLGHTAVPSITAEIHVESLERAPTCLAMQGIGSGAEAAAILENLEPYRALFVIEDSYLPLALVFTLRDYSAWLSRGRLVLLVGADPAAAVAAFYDAHRGYNPIGRSIAWTWRSPRENRTFVARVTAAMQEHNRRVQVRMQQLLTDINNAPAAPPDKAGEMVAANYTRALTVTDYCASRDALAGLGALNCRTDWMVLNRPDVVAHEAQLLRLTELRPDLLIMVDALRGDFSALLPERALCVSLLRDLEAAPAPEKLGQADLVCPPDGEQAQRLVEAGFARERVVVTPPAANPELFRPIELDPAQRDRLAADVLFIGERHSIEPEAYDLKLPTHQQLWRQVAAEIRRDPAGYTAGKAGLFLARAQECGVQIQSEDLRKVLSEQVSRRYGETVLCEAYLEALAEARGNALSELGLRLWSPAARPDGGLSDEPGGWGESPVARFAAGTVGYGEHRNMLFNAARIVLHIRGDGRADRTLLDAIAAGAFVLVRADRDHEKEGGLGSMFRLGKELATFTDPCDLVRKVKHYLDRPEERASMAQAARARLLGEHTWQIRMAAILAAAQISRPRS